MQDMINYVKDMLDYNELHRQAEIYDCDILEFEDEYMQIPKMVKDVSFTYLKLIFLKLLHLEKKCMIIIRKSLSFCGRGQNL